MGQQPAGVVAGDPASALSAAKQLKMQMQGRQGQQQQLEHQSTDAGHGIAGQEQGPAPEQNQRPSLLATKQPAKDKAVAGTSTLHSQGEDEIIAQSVVFTQQSAARDHLAAVKSDGAACGHLQHLTASQTQHQQQSSYQQQQQLLLQQQQMLLMNVQHGQQQQQEEQPRVLLQRPTKLFGVPLLLGTRGMHGFNCTFMQPQTGGSVMKSSNTTGVSSICPAKDLDGNSAGISSLTCFRSVTISVTKYAQQAAAWPAPLNGVSGNVLIDMLQPPHHSSSSCSTRLQPIVAAGCAVPCVAGLHCAIATLFL
jgi:hypothetical protein